MAEASDSLMKVSIADEGPGFAWQEYLTISPDRAFAPNGRGIAVSRQMAFVDMQYLGSGNKVEVSFRQRTE